MCPHKEEDKMRIGLQRTKKAVRHQLWDLSCFGFLIMEPSGIALIYVGLGFLWVLPVRPSAFSSLSLKRHRCQAFWNSSFELWPTQRCCHQVGGR